MEVVLLVLAVIVVIAFYLGKRSGSSTDSNVSVEVGSSGYADYDDYEDDENHDSWEGGFWDASDPKRLSAHIEIDYKDGDGALTTRSVRVREFDNQLYSGIIMGHCELRNATRTFRFDRIKKCVDIETGEIVTDIRKYLNDLYDKSPERSIDIIAIDYIDVLKVIYFVAKADGRYRKAEKEVISGYVRKLVRDDRITPEMIDGLLKEVDVPTLHGYKLAVGRVLKGGEVDPELLDTCCKEIVATQKSVHPMEKEALEYLEKKRSTLVAKNA